jgi:hypothetical protein
VDERGQNREFCDFHHKFIAGAVSQAKDRSGDAIANDVRNGLGL